MTDTLSQSGLNWQPIETCPWQTVVYVRNEQMDFPVKATRGYADPETGIVSGDPNLFTTHFTPDPDGFFPVPAGRLACPTEWAPCEEPTHD